MPSLSKQDSKTTVEGPECMKQVLQLVDKKLRNLEKRKGKLDTYREKAGKGEVLNEDQKAAISKYSEVMCEIDLLKDLQKQMSTVSADAVKEMKRAVKQEKQEQQQRDISRISTVIQIQDVLNELGDEGAREDIVNGRNGAPKLSKDNLDQLDSFFQLITIIESEEEEGTEADQSKKDQKYADRLQKAAEHFHALLESSNKPVIKAVTYKDIRSVIDTIIESGYFENNHTSHVPLSTAMTTKVDIPEDKNDMKDQESVNATMDMAGQVADEASEIPDTVKDPEQYNTSTPALAVAPGPMTTEMKYANNANGNAVQPDHPIASIPVLQSQSFNVIENNMNIEFLQDDITEDPAIVAIGANENIQALPSQMMTSAPNGMALTEQQKEATAIVPDTEVDKTQMDEVTLDKENANDKTATVETTEQVQTNQSNENPWSKPIQNRHSNNNQNRGNYNGQNYSKQFHRGGGSGYQGQGYRGGTNQGYGQANNSVGGYSGNQGRGASAQKGFRGGPGGYRQQQQQY